VSVEWAANLSAYSYVETLRGRTGAELVEELEATRTKPGAA
jgi:hypothetical protein